MSVTSCTRLILHYNVKTEIDQITALDRTHQTCRIAFALAQFLPWLQY